MRKLWETRVSSRKWACMITPTTKYPYTPRGIEMANAALTELLRALRGLDPGMKYAAVMDLNRNGSIHFHVAYAGIIPKERRLKARWKRLTGCYNLKVTPAHSNIGFYLAMRASELPRIKDDSLPAWRGVTRKSFRRVRCTVGLFPSPPKDARAKEPRWKASFAADGEYPEHLLNSLGADIALPREAGDTADHPSLTGEAHGHEGKRRRQGVLVQDVRVRIGRWGSIGDKRELDARDEAPSRAVVGATQ